MILWEPHPNQSRIMLDNHRFKAIVCGRRFGKTTLAINTLVEKAMATDNGLFWYVSPTYRQSKTIAWRMLVNIYYKIPEAFRVAKNESELWVELKNQHNTTSRIELKGADNEDSLRGSGLSGIIIDEVASISSYKTLWEEVLRPALTDKKGWGMFIGTPKGFNHFYELWEKGNRADTDYKSWRFTSFDNPFIDKNEIEAAKRELTEDAFAQEYLADFRKHTGLIYKEFDRRVHVIAPFELPGHWQFHCGMDFGAVNPTVCLWFAVAPNDDIYLYDEYYQSGQTSKFHAGVVKAKTKYNVIMTWGDPSAEQEQLDYATEGLIITPANRFYNDGQDWVNSGIDKVRQVLKIDSQTQRPRLFIFNNCEKTIKEFETYRWIDRKDSLNSKETAVKENDHCMDALRYFIGSHLLVNKQNEYILDLDRNPFTSY